MTQNKILQKGTNITQGETSVLIKYGCLSSLPRSDRWGRSAYFGFCCIFLNQGYSGSMKTGRCMPALLASLHLAAPCRPKLHTQAKNFPTALPTESTAYRKFVSDALQSILAKTKTFNQHLRRVLFTNLHIPKKTTVQFTEVNKIG